MFATKDAVSYNANVPPAPDGRADIVLLVERDPSVRDLYRTALERAGGFGVVAARDDMDAVRRLGVFTPDAIVVDLASTSDNGRHLLAAMAERQLEHVPVVAIGRPDAEPADAFARVIPQPIDLDDLVAAVLLCLNERGQPPVTSATTPDP